MAYEAGSRFTFELSLDEATAREHRVVPGTVDLAIHVFRRDGEPGQAPQHALDGDGLASGLGWLSGGVAGRCNELTIE